MTTLFLPGEEPVELAEPLHVSWAFPGNAVHLDGRAMRVIEACYKSGGIIARDRGLWGWVAWQRHKKSLLRKLDQLRSETDRSQIK